MPLTAAHAVELKGNINAVKAGGNYTLLLKNDGTLCSFGENLMGQLGDGTKTNRFTPVSVNGLSNIKSLAAGYIHALAVDDDCSLTRR